MSDYNKYKLINSKVLELIYFFLVLHFIQNPVTWFAQQIEWLGSLWNAAPGRNELTSNVRFLLWKNPSKSPLCYQSQLIWGPYFLDGKRKNTTLKMLKEFPTRVAVFVVAVPLRLVLLLFLFLFWMDGSDFGQKSEGNQNRVYIAIPDVCF